MYQYLYDLYLTSEINDCTDLSMMAMPMLLADAKSGAREYTDPDTDLEALHQDYEALHDAQQELLEFVGRYGQELAECFQAHDREAFDALVEELRGAEE